MNAGQEATRPIDAVRGHFKRKGYAHIDVSEWKRPDGSALRIFYQPLTIQDREWAIKHSGGGNGVYAYLLIRKAVNGQGAPLFNLGDMAELSLFTDSTVLFNVVSAMLAGSDLPMKI